MQLNGEDDFPGPFATLLIDPAAAQQLVSNARRTLDKHRATTRRTAAAILAHREERS